MGAGTHGLHMRTRPAAGREGGETAPRCPAQPRLFRARGGAGRGGGRGAAGRGARAPAHAYKPDRARNWPPRALAALRTRAFARRLQTLSLPAGGGRRLDRSLEAMVTLRAWRFSPGGSAGGFGSSDSNFYSRFLSLLESLSPWNSRRFSCLSFLPAAVTTACHHGQLTF